MQTHDDTKAEMIHNLELDDCTLQGLGLTEEYIPSSAVYGYHIVNIKPGSGEEGVTIHSLEEYIDRGLYLVSAHDVRKRSDDLRQGFNKLGGIHT